MLVKINTFSDRLCQLRFIAIFIPLALLVGCVSSGDEPADSPDSPVAQEKIISLNGTITELLYSLGYGDRIVGVDVTSTYPAAATDTLPKLGHVSQLNVEAILALGPNKIFVTAEDASKEGLQKLRSAGIEVLPIEVVSTLENSAEMANQLAAHLDIPQQQIQLLENAMAADRQKLESVLDRKLANAKAPKVLFIYARGTGRILVAGKSTEAARMIELAGGENAITTFDDFEAMTPESLVAAAPDVILMFSSGLASLDGKQGLGQVPGIEQTPAYRNDNVVAMDGQYLLGFGPRAGQAATELAEKLIASNK